MLQEKKLSEIGESVKGNSRRMTTVWWKIVHEDEWCGSDNFNSLKISIVDIIKKSRNAKIHFMLR